VKRLSAEFLGTLLITMAVIGSGIMASFLTEDVLLQLLVNMFSTVAALYVAIVIFMPRSGANFNPLVSILKWMNGQLIGREVFKDVAAQLLGAFIGALLVAIIFERDLIEISSFERHGFGTFVAEIIASTGLLIVALIRIDSSKSHKRAVLVSTWIAGAYFFTSSTSFANPAVTFGRIFTESFAGISPLSFFAFLAAQVIGALVAFLALRSLED
jgi:glycerol uptake facilitator-like aquaporin